MAAKEGRFGRKNGKGSTITRRTGPKSLWPGLAKIVGKRIDPDDVSVKDLKDRFLFTVALEAARCMGEGIVTYPREADVGSILGFGDAPYSGGAVSFIDGMGLKAFVTRAKELAGKYGPQIGAGGDAHSPWPSAARPSTEPMARSARPVSLRRLERRSARGRCGGA